MRGSNKKKSFMGRPPHHGSPSSMSPQIGASPFISSTSSSEDESVGVPYPHRGCLTGRGRAVWNAIIRSRGMANRGHRERTPILGHYPALPISHSPTSPSLCWSGPTTSDDDHSSVKSSEEKCGTLSAMCCFKGRGRVIWGGIYGNPRPNGYHKPTGRGRIAWTSKAILRPANEEGTPIFSGRLVANRGRRERTPLLAHYPTSPGSPTQSQPSLRWSGPTTTDDDNTSTEQELCGTLSSSFATTIETGSSMSSNDKNADFGEEHVQDTIITSRAYFAKGYGHGM